MNEIVEEFRYMATLPYYRSRKEILLEAANEIESLQKEINHLNTEAENRRIKIFEISDQLIDANHTIRELRKQIAELTVKKTQVYNPPKPSIGNFSS